jgi:hypothetical protein
MMTTLANLVLLAVFSAPAHAETVTEILRCTSPLLGAPVYSIERLEPEAQPVFYRLSKIPNNPFFGPYTENVVPQDVIEYGNTTILTVDRGRSGYALVYANNDVTVIDVNLFQNPEMNTDGPVTAYTCVR